MFRTKRVIFQLTKGAVILITVSVRLIDATKTLPT